MIHFPASPTRLDEVVVIQQPLVPRPWLRWRRWQLFGDVAGWPRRVFPAKGIHQPRPVGTVILPPTTGHALLRTKASELASGNEQTMVLHPVDALDVPDRGQQLPPIRKPLVEHWLSWSHALHVVPPPEGAFSRAIGTPSHVAVEIGMLIDTASEDAKIL